MDDSLLSRELGLISVLGAAVGLDGRSRLVCRERDVISGPVNHQRKNRVHPCK